MSGPEMDAGSARLDEIYWAIRELNRPGLPVVHEPECEVVPSE